MCPVFTRLWFLRTSRSRTSWGRWDLPRWSFPLQISTWRSAARSSSCQSVSSCLPTEPDAVCGPKFCHLSESHGSKGVSRVCALTQRRPPVPARTDRPPMGQTKGGFIKPAVMAPLKPTPVSVDSHKGHKQLLETSGLVPKYVTKKVLFYTLLTVYPSSS